MSAPFKLALAIVFAVGSLVFGRFFYQSYNELTSRPDPRMDIDFSDNRPEDLTKTAEIQAEPETTSALSSSVSPEAASAARTGEKNAEASAESGIKSQENGEKTAQTNTTTPPGSSSTQAPQKRTPDPKSTESVKQSALLDKSPTKGSNSKLGLFAACFLGCLLGFGFLGGHTISQYIGNKTIKTIYNDEGEGMTNPGYDEAEQVWADGDHLEAIRLMRDYLAKNPREQHVALRIAEIYEKDLKNALAAALEYEEVLTKKLPPERWAWAAIHLCNLYYKINKADKAFLLLKRIDAEYGQTAAAEKARKRLALIETGGAEPAPTEESGQET